MELDSDLPAESIDERPQRRREWSGAGRSIVLPLLIVAAIVAAVWYLERSGGSGAITGDGYGIMALDVARNSTGRPVAVEIGRAAPDFRLARLGGGDLRLSDLRGTVVLLTFWASWCVPCRTQMPEFVRLYGELQPKGLEILAVDVQEAADPAQTVVDEFGMRFPILFDRSGSVARTYRVEQLPVTLLIDRDGVIRATTDGSATLEVVRAELAKLL